MAHEKSDSKLSCGKRNALKALAVGGAAIPAWKAPVVQSLALPAHAATTTGQYSGPIFILFGANETQDSLGTEDEYLARVEAGPLNWLIDDAQAQDDLFNGHVCINVSGGEFSCDVQIQCASYSGSGTVGGSPASVIGGSCIDETILLEVTTADESRADFLVYLPNKTGYDVFPFSAPVGVCDYSFRCGCEAP